MAQAEGDLARAVGGGDPEEDPARGGAVHAARLARDPSAQQELDNAVQNNLANLASVDAARANVDKAKANVTTAQAAVDKAQADVQVAQANIVQAKAGLEEAQLNFGWTKVLSPINGIAGIKKVDIGDLVGTATVLTTVAQVDPIYVQFSLSEQEYLRWRAAHPVRTTGLPDFGLILSDGATYPHKGTADILGLEVDTTTGTIPVRVAFPNPGNLLRPGQFGKVRFAIATVDRALLVPQRAVQDLQGLYQVGIVGADDTVTVRTVQVGEGRPRGDDKGEAGRARRGGAREGRDGRQGDADGGAGGAPGGAEPPGVAVSSIVPPRSRSRSDRPARRRGRCNCIALYPNIAPGDPRPATYGGPRWPDGGGADRAAGAAVLYSTTTGAAR